MTRSFIESTEHAAAAQRKDPDEIPIQRWKLVGSSSTIARASIASAKSAAVPARSSRCRAWVNAASRSAAKQPRKNASA